MHLVHVHHSVPYTLLCWPTEPAGRRLDRARHSGLRAHSDVSADVRGPVQQHARAAVAAAAAARSLGVRARRVQTLPRLAAKSPPRR